MSIRSQLSELQETLPEGVTLVAVSKTFPAEDIMEAYDSGQRVFGENRPQEMKAKYEELPKDIRWHLIGHLQTNKVKYVVPFVELIHSVDSEKLMDAIQKEAAKINRTVDVLLEVHIAQEESKHGWDERELDELFSSGQSLGYPNIRIRGLMGIATYTEDIMQVRREFTGLKGLFERYRQLLSTETLYGSLFDTLSMGMTSDYKVAVECGANMVRVGSLIFGARNYEK